ncbi:HEAT repeat domain-containing protein [Candidatus Altiarchaeota archaeon]
MKPEVRIIPILFIISLLLVSGCLESKTSGKKAPVKTTGQKLDEVIDNLDENDPVSIAKVEDLVELGEPAVPMLKEKLADDDVVTRWAASYALSNIGPTSSQATQENLIPDLVNAYDDDEDTISVTAAATAVGMGEKSGFPILIRSLRNDDSLIFIEPRRSISAYALHVLRAYTGQEFGYDLHTPLSEREKAINDWEAWWAQNKDKLVWAPDMGGYGGYKV